MNSAKTPTGKGSKGAVGLEKLNDRIRLNLPRQWFNGNQKRVSLGLSWTKENVTFAESLAKQMELDWLSGHFDLTLTKYLPSKKQQLNNVVDLPGKRAEMPLLELWDKWCEYRKPSLKITTYQSLYCRVFRNFIKDAQEAVGNDAVAICNWLIENRYKARVLDTLNQLSKSHTWGMKQGFVSNNPYDDLVEDIKKSKAVSKSSKRDDDGNIVDNDDDDSDVRAFSLDEAQAIIEAYEISKTVSHYTPLVKLLFYTGCRSGEACALKWKHIKQGCTVITFEDSFDSLTKTTGDTKTYVKRIFRLTENSKLYKLLKQLESERLEPENPNELVLKSKTGKQIDWTNFGKTWRGKESENRHSIVKRLVEQGKVKQYLKPYATRHTFITAHVNAGYPAHAVAGMVGNSANVIWEHYFDKSQKDSTALDF